jgi:hypothetical protein
MRKDSCVVSFVTPPPNVGSSLQGFTQIPTGNIWLYYFYPQRGAKGGGRKRTEHKKQRRHFIFAGGIYLPMEPTDWLLVDVALLLIGRTISGFNHSSLAESPLRLWAQSNFFHL